MDGDFVAFNYKKQWHSRNDSTVDKIKNVALYSILFNCVRDTTLSETKRNKHSTGNKQETKITKPIKKYIT